MLTYSSVISNLDWIGSICDIQNRILSERNEWVRSHILANIYMLFFLLMLILMFFL